jgi:ribosomal protein S18 acetylase RimI-like enzyme
MKFIRPFAPEDISQVAELHRRAFRTADRNSPRLGSCTREYFTDIFLNHPWSEEGIASLVYEEDGRVAQEFAPIDDFVPGEASLSKLDGERPFGFRRIGWEKALPVYSDPP